VDTLWWACLLPVVSVAVGGWPYLTSNLGYQAHFRLTSYDSTLNPFAADDDNPRADHVQEPDRSSTVPSNPPSKSVESSPAKCTNIPSHENIPDITVMASSPSKKTPGIDADDKSEKKYKSLLQMLVVFYAFFLLTQDLSLHRFI